MAEPLTLKQVLERMGKALAALEKAAESRMENDQVYAEAEEEVQRLNADRSRLAQELDDPQYISRVVVRVADHPDPHRSGRLAC